MKLPGQWGRDIGLRLASRAVGLEAGLNEIGAGLRGRNLDPQWGGASKGEANGLGLRRGVGRLRGR